MSFRQQSVALRVVAPIRRYSGNHQSSGTRAKLAVKATFEHTGVTEGAAIELVVPFHGMGLGAVNGMSQIMGAKGPVSDLCTMSAYGAVQSPCIANSHVRSPPERDAERVRFQPVRLVFGAVLNSGHSAPALRVRIGC